MAKSNLFIYCAEAVCFERTLLILREIFQLDPLTNVVKNESAASNKIFKKPQKDFGHVWMNCKSFSCRFVNVMIKTKF